MLYSIVDPHFIGQIPGEGALALAGAGVCGPVVTMVGSVAFLVGVGGAPLLSISAARATTMLRGHSGQLLFDAVRVLGGAAAAILPFRELMLGCSARDATYPYAEAYFTLYLLGNALCAVGLRPEPVHRMPGFAADGMKIRGAGRGANIMLDPVFIFAFGLGVRGAAIATVLSQLASCVLCGALSVGQSPIRITRADIPRPS